MICKENEYNTFFTGDLNNDGKDDIICHSKKGFIRYALSNNTIDKPFDVVMETVELSWCNDTRDEILKGDSNYYVKKLEYLFCRL